MIYQGLLRSNSRVHSLLTHVKKASVSLHTKQKLWVFQKVLVSLKTAKPRPTVHFEIWLLPLNVYENFCAP